MRAHRFNQSSTIDRIVYDDQARTLCISFRDTGKYVYEGVPSSLFEAFCRASSAGGFFNERIKDRYRFPSGGGSGRTRDRRTRPRARRGSVSRRLCSDASRHCRASGFAVFAP
jgi:hypothetical protein